MDWFLYDIVLRHERAKNIFEVKENKRLVREEPKNKYCNFRTEPGDFWGKMFEITWTKNLVSFHIKII